MNLIAEDATLAENVTAGMALVVGTVLMSLIIYGCYLISLTCVYPLVDGKCQNQTTEQSPTEE